jgi:hypothetical protein
MASSRATPLHVQQGWRGIPSTAVEGSHGDPHDRCLYRTHVNSLCRAQLRDVRQPRALPQVPFCSTRLWLTAARSHPAPSLRAPITAVSAPPAAWFQRIWALRELSRTPRSRMSSGSGSDILSAKGAGQVRERSAEARGAPALRRSTPARHADRDGDCRARVLPPVQAPPPSGTRSPFWAWSEGGLVRISTSPTSRKSRRRSVCTRFDRVFTVAGIAMSPTVRRSATRSVPVIGAS